MTPYLTVVTWINSNGDCLPAYNFAYLTVDTRFFFEEDCLPSQLRPELIPRKTLYLTEETGINKKIAYPLTFYFPRKTAYLTVETRFFRKTTYRY